MPKKAGGMGMGSKAMGGAGKKPAMPKSPMMGTPPAPGGLASAASSGGMSSGRGGPRAAPSAVSATPGGPGMFKKGGKVDKK